MLVPEALDVQRLEGRVREMTQQPQAYCSTCQQQPLIGQGTHLLFIEGTMVLTLRYNNLTHRIIALDDPFSHASY